MLDENLPTFYIKPSVEKPKYQSTYYFCQGGEEPAPAYSIRHLDPTLPASKNRYAVALYDSFCPDILYGEVLLIPKWTQPSLSQEAIRQNGGIPPPPEPILPNEFIIQLYNPDQQVLVRHKPKTWNSPALWEFQMPQQTFRRPSASALDRTLSDPAASDITPKLRFSWQKDGKFSKDLTCYLSGTTSDLEDARKRSKEPDITISIFKGLREITLYEPNLYRVEMEDSKGLEVVLLLGAIVIRDVYFGHIKTSFHVSDPPSPGILTESKPTIGRIPVNGPPPQTKQSANSPQNDSSPPQVPPRQTTLPVREARPPPTDPRSQWEIDAETKRLKLQAEAETRERRLKEKEAEKQTRKLLEAEEREKRKRQAKLEEETERLKKLYGKEDNQSRKQQTALKPQSTLHPPPNMPPRPQQFNTHHPRHSSFSVPGSSWPGPPARPLTTQPSPQFPVPRPPASTVGGLRPPEPRLKEKRSIFGFRLGDNNKNCGNVLTKKRSSMF